MTSSLYKNYPRTINLFHQWCTFNLTIRQKYYVICHVNETHRVYISFCTPTRGHVVKIPPESRFLQQRGKRRKREGGNLKFDFRGKRLISILGFKLAKRKIDSKLLEAWKREKRERGRRKHGKHAPLVCCTASRCGVEKWTDRVEWRWCRRRHEMEEWKTEN